MRGAPEQGKRRVISVSPHPPPPKTRLGPSWGGPHLIKHVPKVILRAHPGGYSIAEENKVLKRDGSRVRVRPSPVPAPSLRAQLPQPARRPQG